MATEKKEKLDGNSLPFILGLELSPLLTMP